MASAVIGALRVNLSADTAEFKRNLTEAETAAKKFGVAVSSGLKMGALALAAGATAAAAGLALLTKNSFETISAQVDLARRVGASVAAIQTLEHATELSGGSAEGLAKALGSLNAKLGDAAEQGAGPAYEAMQRLGLSIQEVANSDADVRIKMISDRMTELGYSSQQQADTLKDLGIKQQELINLFQEGSGAIEDARSELQAWGVLLSDVDASKVEAAGDAWDKLHTILTGIGNQIAIRLAPLVQTVAEYVGDAAKETGGFGDVIDKVIIFGIRLWSRLNQEIYQTRVDIDGMIGEVLDLWDAFAGAPANLLASVFGGTAEDYGFKPVNVSFGKLKDTLKKPPSDEEWIRYFEEKKKQFDQLAQTATKIGRPSEFNGEVNDRAAEQQAARDAKEQERLAEQQAQQLEALQESLMTEEEAEQASFDKRLAQIEQFHNDGLISDAQYKDLLLRNEEELAKNLKDISDDIAKQQARSFMQQANAWFDIADSIGTSLQGIFGESKAIAIAQAIINTAQAITRTLAEYGATPLGFAAAAAAAAAGAAQIATINRTTKQSKGGGGGGGGFDRHSGGSTSAPSSSAGQSAAAPGSNQTLFINGLTTGALYSGEAVRELASKLIEFQRDGGKIVLGPA